MISEQLKIVGAVNSFSYAMTAKMIQKHEKGFTGWEDKTNKEMIIFKLNQKIEQVRNGDLSQCVDAANYLMMLNNFRNAG
jgi:hypothetical protein